LLFFHTFCFRFTRFASVSHILLLFHTLCFRFTHFALAAGT
jgi:hypothetical protein